MYKVYLLHSLKDTGMSYVGLTIKEIDKRVEEHNKGLSQYTKTFKPWRLVYYELFYCRTCAEKREQFLKSGVGYQLRKHLLTFKNSSLKNGD